MKLYDAMGDIWDIMGNSPEKNYKSAIIFIRLTFVDLFSTDIKLIRFFIWIPCIASLFGHTQKCILVSRIFHLTSVFQEKNNGESVCFL
jgi:hypothetical protein